jgi:uncharacterized protein (DUF2147 family)
MLYELHMRIVTKRSAVLILLLVSMLSGFSQSKDVLVGRWLTAKGDAHIQIYQLAGKYSGKIAWIKDPNDDKGKPELDKKNPDQSLRTRPILGIEILQNFAYVGEGVWEGGNIYDPQTGKTYDCKISMMNKDKINVRGFVGISLLGRTETWSRVR